VPQRPDCETNRSVVRVTMSARQVASESSEDEYFSVGAQVYGGADTSDSDADSAETTSMAPPRHPVLAMQGAFEESIFESSEPNPQPRSKDESAETRRQRILEARQYDDSWTTRWKQKPSARHHPLAKLMAQIVFGMHLLQQQQAKSDEEVVKILQTHVDEVDNFLEKATEDFDLAIKDISERIHFLKLPMAHPDVFGTMLEDKQFRTQLMEGNEKIETIIERTSRAMNAALLDVQRAKAATKELGHYLNAVSDEWPGEKSDLEAVLNAMRGNEQGWKHCLRELQNKAHDLRDNLDQLSTVIREMARMAAAASRRTRSHGRAASSGQSAVSAIPRSKFSSDGQRTRAMSIDKPLPKAPINTNSAVELEAHPVPMERRYEQPRPTPVSPSRVERARAPRSSTVPSRPRTSSSGMTPRDSRNMSQNGTNDIVEFLKEAREPSPLRSHPSGEGVGLAKGAGNPKRQSAIDVVEHARSLSRSGRDDRPRTADGNTALPHYRRSSSTEPARTEPHRVGIERNKHGPPPAGGREQSRRSSSIGYVFLVGISASQSLTNSSPFIRRLSFRSNKKEQSPPPAAATPPETRPVTSKRRPSATSMQRDTTSPTNYNTNSATDRFTQRTTSPNLALPTNQTSDAPSTPSATSGRSTTDSPSLTVTTPGTENLSPATKSDSTEKAPTRPRLVNGNSTSAANANTNGSVTNKSSVPSKVAPPPEEKKRGRGMSFMRFFGGGNKPQKERLPRAAMTYGDLA
jgi:hypothetical protein